jgi:hypothetical protein
MQGFASFYAAYNFFRRAPSRVAIRGMAHPSPPSCSSINQEESTNEILIPFPLLAVLSNSELVYKYESTVTNRVRGARA